MYDRLEAFLYLLMRDELPTGKVDELIRKMPAEGEMVFMAPELHGLAYRYARRIAPEQEESAEEREKRQSAWLAAAPGRILEVLRDERAESGHGLTLVELADKVGWDVGDEGDLMEASSAVQHLYEQGFVNRDLAPPDAPDPRIYLTEDGATALDRGLHVEQVNG